MRGRLDCRAAGPARGQLPARPCRRIRRQHLDQEGSDQAMWVTELGKDRIARIIDGQVRASPPPPAPMEVQCGGRCPHGIASGPDGNLWITKSQLAAGDQVGRMTTTGQSQSWPLPEAGAALND
ncbi:MAG: virginiamycin B lyase family protein, partial [Candidatus Dormibacterales bacterium]